MAEYQKVKLVAGTDAVGHVVLDAGTAEIGKLAAGTASIGTVGLNAGTNNVGDVDIASPLNASGYVKVAEQGTVTVSVSGTPNVNATLQTGTAEIGKLAAGSASIGTVVLGAGTAEVGKLAAGTANIGDVDIASPLDGSGNVKTAEQLAPVSIAYSRTMIYDQAGAENTTTTVRTVTAGKTYFLVHAQLFCRSTVDNTEGRMIINGSVALDIFTAVTATYKTSDVQTETLAPATPIPVPAGATIQVYSNNISHYATVLIAGWEQ